MTTRQHDTIRARRDDATAQQMREDGVGMSWAEADSLGDDAHDWIRSRLGLRCTTDSNGVRYAPRVEDAEAACAPPDPRRSPDPDADAEEEDKASRRARARDEARGIVADGPGNVEATAREIDPGAWD